MTKVKSMKKELLNPELLLKEYGDVNGVLEYLDHEFDRRFIYLRYSRCTAISDRLVNQINEINRLIYFYRYGVPIN